MHADTHTFRIYAGEPLEAKLLKELPNAFGLSDHGVVHRVYPLCNSIIS